MNADIILLADAITAALNDNAALWEPQEFTAGRVYVPEFELTDPGLHVSVVPKEIESRRASQKLQEADTAVDIGVQQKLADSTPASVDPLVLLCQQIQDYFERNPLSGFPDAELKPLTTKNAPIYDPAMLREKNVFLSVITLTYRLFR